MAEPNNLPVPPETLDALERHLASLKLSGIAVHQADRATPAAPKAWSHGDDLATLLEGEGAVRRDRATQSRMRLARVPVIKTCEPCRWDWPTRMNRLQVQHHVRLGFLQDKATLIVLGGVGLGKTPWATAWGYAAGLYGDAVRCASASAVLNTLAAAKSAGRLQAARTKYTTPALLLLDALGALPRDKTGADLRCQVIRRREEQGARSMTAHRAFKEWPTLVNHDSPLTSTVLDRLLHHADTIILEGKSFRMQDPRES